MPLIHPFRKVTCLYCDHEFHLSKARWWDLAGARVESPQTQRKLNLETKPSLPPVKSQKSNFGLSRFYIPPDDDERRIKVCPECLLPLTSRAANGYTDNEQIALLAGPDAGKSQIIWAAIKKAIEPTSNLPIEATLDRTVSLPDLKPEPGDLVWRNYYSSFIEKGMTIPKTVTEAVYGKIGLIPPLTVRLSLKYRPLLQRILKPFDDFRSAGLSLFERDGEVYADETSARQFDTYIRRAKAFIILVDPRACSTLYPHLDGNLVGTTRDRTLAVLNRIARTLKLDGSKRLQTPCAVVITMSDLLRRRFEADNPTSAWHHPPDYRKGFDIVATDSISHDLRGYLMEGLAGEQIVAKVNGLFSTVRYFACSALGHEPIPTGNPDDQFKFLSGPATPFRVLEPLLWVLSRRGLISTKPIPEGLREDSQGGPNNGGTQ